MAKYQLTLTEQQASIIRDALEIYSRIGMGQIGTGVTSHPDIEKRIWETSGVCSFDLSNVIDTTVKSYIYPEFRSSINSYYGIFSEAIGDSNRIAWDIQQVIRHRLSWDKVGNPPQREWNTMMGVSFDEPMKSSEEELPTIVRLEGSDA